MGTEDITLEFTSDAVDEMANFAFRVNESTEDIGARRLATILEGCLGESIESRPGKEASGHRCRYVQQARDIVRHDDLTDNML